jgi:hypothetical protein
MMNEQTAVSLSTAPRLYDLIEDATDGVDNLRNEWAVFWNRK